MKTTYYYLILCLSFSLSAQTYWQQKGDYTMDVSLDVKTFQYKGSQVLRYSNNSPDTLKSVYYHLFYNAFQPNSEMAIRIKNGKDRNGRFRANFDTLQPQNQGYLKVSNLKQDGKLLNPKVSGTILEVPLAKPLLPQQTTTLSLEFNGQVPSMIRRAGKMSREGVVLSMAQWFPKMAEYDYDGWNAEPYLGREFHGVWGNYDVSITLDKTYTVAASGYLQNKEEVGHGYAEVKKTKAKRGQLQWHFIAPNVHDFTWAADPNYIHDTYPGPNGVTLHFFYKNDPEIIENWKKLQPVTAALMQFYNTTIGPYPYDQYSVVQGGDGGMEYAMLTLITGGRSFNGLVGVTAHELAHSWFQHILATNEMKHEWMDEGFTSYISAYAEAAVLEQPNDFPVENSYLSYFSLARSGYEQPQMTNANRYAYNAAYERTAYSKGAVFLAQLGYIIGQDKLAKTLQEYYREFKFKHPQPNDFRRVAERVSGLQLKWYLTDWTQTTNTIDYAIKDVRALTENQTEVVLERIGQMPMPIDLLVNLKEEEQRLYYIPLALMRGEKENPYALDWTLMEDWTWANPEYRFVVDVPLEKIQSIIIDPTFFMADIDRENNLYVAEEIKEPLSE
ncbi:MAG: M1 family metallopeptidase [Flavobacteriaceae bacterium]